MKISFLILLLTAGLATGLSTENKLITKTGEASFYSKAPLEDIEAHNSNVLAILDLDTKEVAVKMLIKQFEFENSLMQEHFNENYMETDKFPSAIFSGKIMTDKDLSAQNSGTLEVEISGDITIHGVTKPLTTKATLSFDNGVLKATTEFKAKTADYDIEIPKLVVKNIAEVIDVKLSFEFSTANS